MTPVVEIGIIETNFGNAFGKKKLFLMQCRHV